jgi:outer membrane protein TolC
MRRFHLPRSLPGLLGLTLLGWVVGCSETQPLVRGASQSPTDLPAVNEQQPKEETLPPAKPAEKLGFSSTKTGKQVPISLDTVFRLAESQNGQTTIARLKVDEAFANCDLAAKGWIPDLWVGTGYYRHDGGIVNPADGELVHPGFNAMFAGVEMHSQLDWRDVVYRKVDAERRLWQQRAEVSKLNHEALTEASTTYMDLLAARAAEATAEKIVNHLQELLQQTEALAKTVAAVELDVVRIQTEIQSQQQMLRKMREGALAATAKLIYQLGFDPASELVVMERQLAALNLVNADAPVEELVSKALENGPAVRELEGMLTLIHQAQEKSQGLAQYLPVLDFYVAEGAFGAGPNATMSWDNRVDVGIEVRWNLTEWCTARERQRVAQAKIGQAHATYQDLQAKITMGVQEAREAVRSGHDQMDLGLQQLKLATDAFDRSKSRFMQSPNLKERSPSEVLLAIRSLNAAHLGYLMAIRDHDKAQLRLAILTGLVAHSGDH